MSYVRVLLPLLIALAGCSTKGTSGSSSAATAQPTSAAAPASSSAPAATPTAASTPSAAGSAVAATPLLTAAPIAPPIPRVEKGMMDHLLPSAGWTKDGSALGYSVAIAVNLVGELLRPNGARESFHMEGEDPAEAKKFHARVGALGFLGAASGNWPYAGELEITWAATGGCEKEPPVAERIEVGARVPGEPPAYPIKLVLQLKDSVCYGSAHPEVIAVSPDGQYLGAIAHGFAGEWANDYPMGIATIAAVAEGAYNNAGLAHHKKGDYARSAELFAKAAAADPTSKAASFNLACALARLGDARAERALGDAIARGGDEVKKKAQKDEDFAGVRSKPWFAALVK